MSDFFSRLRDPGLHLHYYVSVPSADSGWFFSSCDLPAAFTAQTVVCLDPATIQTSDNILSRKAGCSSPRSMVLKLGPKNSDRLTYVLAPNRVGSDGLYTEGRLAYVVAALCDATGAMIDTSLYTDAGDTVPAHSCVIFAGPIESVQVDDDWHSYSMAIQSLEALLDTEIGGDKIEGSLAPINAGTDPGNFLFGVAATPDADRVAFDWTHNISSGMTGAATRTLTASISGKSIDIVTVGLAMADAINAELSANGYAESCTPFWTSNTLDIDGQSGFLGDMAKDAFRWQIALYYDQDIADHTLTSDSVFTIAPSTQNSCLPVLGFLSPGSGEIAISGAQLDGANALTASEAPLAAYVGFANTEIHVWFNADQPAPPATGYLRLTDGEYVEIVKYSAASAGLNYGGKKDWFFTCQRGRMGTSPREIKIKLEVQKNSENASGYSVGYDRSVAVQVMAGLENTHLFNIIGTLATSDFGPGVWYDPTFPDDYAAAINPDLFASTRITNLVASGGPIAIIAVRSYAFAETKTLRDWCAEELASVGWTLQARIDRDTREYLLTLDQVTEPLLASVWPILAVDICEGGSVQVQHVTSGCANRAVVTQTYDLEGRDDTIKTTIDHVASQTRLNRKIKEEYSLRGVPLNVVGSEMLVAHFLGLLSAYAYPYEIVTLPVRRAFWQVAPGDQISVTLPGIPAPDGGRGWTAEPMLVLGVTRTYQQEGTGPACQLVCLHMPDRRLSYYAPSGLVTGWNAGTKTITISANAFSPVGDYLFDETLAQKDIQWFVGATHILIGRQVSDATAAEPQVASVDVANNKIVLVAAPTNAPVAGDWITLPTWNNRTTWQKIFGAIADASGQLGTANDPGFQLKGV